MSPKKTLDATQPEVNVGLAGHVDSGKTTLVSRLSGSWTDTHSEEIKRGITIRLGYADAVFYQCSKCKGPEAYGVKATCKNCKGKATPLRHVSFIDAPGHESLMATMLSGAAIMDGALLLVAANEDCPQPQTKEHLMALEMIGIKHIIIVQNKIDLVSEEQLKKNYEQIKTFIKGTIAEQAPIIPVAAQHNVNIDAVIQAIETIIKTPKRDMSKEPLLFVARSFDVNKPGTALKDLAGGVIGGSLKQGSFKVKDVIEIRPGQSIEKDGKKTWQAITTTVSDLKTGGHSVQHVGPGGSIGMQTLLDPFYVKSDSLTGNIVGLKGKLPPVWETFALKPNLLQRVVGSKEDLQVEPIKKGEMLMINVNSAATVGQVVDLKKGVVHVKLKLPVCCSDKDRITISRLLGSRWRLIGTAQIIGK